MSKEIIDNTLYRFRSMDALLGSHNELEDQSIFFSSPKNLNDPAEGFRDICFNGDVVLWNSLLKNYLVCLARAIVSYSCCGESVKLEDRFDPVVTEDDIPELTRDIWFRILHGFFKSDYVNELLKKIVDNRKDIRKLELSYYLNLFHPFAASSIFEQLCNKGVFKSNPYSSYPIEKAKSSIRDFFEDFDSLVMKNGGDDEVDIFFLKRQLLIQQFLLLKEYNDGEQGENKKLIISNFPSMYVKNIEKLMFPDWFTACFMSCSSNSSVWGSYAKNHTGACLIFNAQLDSNGKHYLPLNGLVVGCDGNTPITRSYSFEFNEVRYTHKLKPLNFFEAIGVFSAPVFNKQWLVDVNGERSKLAMKFNDDWRHQYWSNFHSDITQKSCDWKFENEYRLILDDRSRDYATLNKKTLLNYDFKSLKGIIFGINTSHEHKLKAIQILSRKACENNHYDFNFFQAYYCRLTGEIKHVKLDMIKINKSDLI
ncbi:TPA: hypothetical protein ACSP2S_000381 [Aeromonas veronii]